MNIQLNIENQEYLYETQILVKAFLAQKTGSGDPEQYPEAELKIELDGKRVRAMLGDIGQSGEAYSEEKKELKAELKRTVYRVMERFTGVCLPWGALTGIRPTKIIMGLLEEKQDITDQDIAEFLRKNYYVSEEKIRLGIDIARREKRILEGIDYDNGYSLYIGIPFCPTTCLYCSFPSYPLGAYEKKTDLYVEALLKEIAYAAEAYGDKKLNSVYLGGGTPTTLTPEQLDAVLGAVRSSFDFQYCREFTVEAGRPDSITAEKLEMLKKHGVERISINPQTMKQETLDLIGRYHSVEQVKEAFHLAREAGFDNINMDFILGLPNETIEDVRNTMEETCKLSPDSITVHSLALKRAAGLTIFKEAYKDLQMENSEEIMELCGGYAKKMGMEPYYMYRQKNMAGNLENVGYAKNGKEGLYNILIMEEKQTILALGAGAVTKYVFPAQTRIERVENVKNVDHYIQRIDEMIERKMKFFERVTECHGAG